MAFMKVDKDRLKRRGSVYVAQTAKGYVIGRIHNNCKVTALLDAAGKLCDGKTLPSIKLVRIKKFRDIYKTEAYLHSMMSDSINKDGYYEVTAEELKLMWKEL